MMVSVEPGGRLPFGMLFGAAWNLLIRNAGWLLLFIVAGIAAMGAFTLAAIAISGREPDPLTVLPILFVGWLVIAVLATAAIDLLHRRIEGGPAAFGLALRTGVERLPRVLALVILFLLAAGLVVVVVASIMPLGIVGSVSSYLGMMMAGHPLPPDFPYIFAMFAAVLVIGIPCGAAFNIFMMLCFIVCVVERRWPISTIERFGAIMKGHWWRGIAAFLLAGLAYLLIDIALLFGAMAGAPGENTPVVMAFVVLRIVWSVFYPPWVASFLVAFYALLRRLQAAPPAAGPAPA